MTDFYTGTTDFCMGMTDFDTGMTDIFCIFGKNGQNIVKLPWKNGQNMAKLHTLRFI